MRHKCVQVRRGRGDKKNIFFAFFWGDIIFAKGMQLKINILLCCVVCTFSLR